MTGIVIVTEVVGDVVIAAKFRKFGARSITAEPAFEEIASLMRDAEREAFSTSGSSSGEAWADLTEETAETKSRKGFPPGILIETEELEGSLTEQGHPGHTEEIAPDFLRFGTTDEVAASHQFGTPNKHDMPARPPLRFRDDQIEGFTYILYTYITKGIADTSMFQL
jgi:phage gpG-like protein